MPSTIDTLKAIAPQFDHMTDAELTVYIELAICMEDRGCIPMCKYQILVANLAAHLLTTAHVLDDGQASPITSKRSGKEGISYASTVGQTGYGLTKYGQMVEHLLRNSGAACMAPLTNHELFCS